MRSLFLCLQYFDTAISVALKATIILLKGVSPRFAHLEKFSLNFFEFVVSNRVNISPPSLTILVSNSLWVIMISIVPFYLIVNYYVQFSFNLKVILYLAKITQNIVTELLKINQPRVN